MLYWFNDYTTTKHTLHSITGCCRTRTNDQGSCEIFSVKSLQRRDAEGNVCTCFSCQWIMKASERASLMSACRLGPEQAFQKDGPQQPDLMK